MSPSQARQLKAIQDALASVPLETAFIGGSIIPLLVDQPKGLDFRETLDFDVMIQVAVALQYAKIEEGLRTKGFQHDDTPGAPICRWKFQGATVDIMPTVDGLYGLNTKWFAEALVAAEWKSLPIENNPQVKIVTPEYFIATKLEAFKDRGKGDYYASHDLEDIVTIVDGVSTIVGRIAALPEVVRTYINAEIRRYLQVPLFREALPGHVVSQSRYTTVLERLEKIAA